MGRQLFLFPDPLDHDCAVDGRGVGGWIGRFFRFDAEEHPQTSGLHAADGHAGTGCYPPAWLRVLCAPRRVLGRRLVAHVRFDGCPVVGTPYGLVLVACDLRAYARQRQRRLKRWHTRSSPKTKSPARTAPRTSAGRPRP